ncbi:MAG: UvrD-helicase domain-containing protein [Thermomonas haemolytica]
MSAPATPLTDWTALPLAGDGRSLVEASAGTGKTWTIAALYLRLLLEQGRSPRQIVVSTFTNAAAAELGERLRGKLLWALAEAAKSTADVNTEAADARWLHARWQGDGDTRARDVRRLQGALAEFDAAPICTLHALCMRILAEHPFAAGALFRSPALVDGKALQAALAADLWRVIAQGDVGDELVALARAAGIERRTLDRYMPVLLQADVVVEGVGPDAFRDRLDFLGDPDVWVAKVLRLVEDDTLFNATCTLRKAWPDVASAIVSAPGNLKQAKGRAKTLADAAKMTGISAAGKKNPEVLELISQSPAIAEALQQISDVEIDRSQNVDLRKFLAAARRWCQAALQARLEAAGQMSFDAVLVAVRDALAPRDGQRALADALFAAWPVALVDEFQDTDPVQFGILDAIYRDENDAPRGRLVMIGDPKQAIYRFRGGDVQTYARASADVAPGDRLVLDTNHRSSRGYVAALNRFYEAVGTRLGPPDTQTPILYQPVQGSARRDDKPLRVGEEDVAVAQPLVLHRLAEENDVDALPVLEVQALRACADHIAWALSARGYRIGTERLAPGDIAVLLPTNAQVAKLAAILKARGVPCVTGSQDSVFDTAVARELRLVLHAVLHADDPRALRAAYATRLWGGTLSGLQALRRDAGGWDALAARFHALHAVLERTGPLALVAALLEQHAARLLQTVAGERMLTDLRHLGELLQEAWEVDGGGERLLAWFADQMEGEGDASDAAEARALRLESDARRVQLMTLHASKGLEFGVVFLPLLWKHGASRGGRQGAALLADPATGAKVLVEGPAQDLVARQEYEERFRMLYVALTRAIHACHVFTLAPAHPARAKLQEVPLNALDLSALEADAEVEGIACRAGWDAPEIVEDGVAAADASLRVARALPPPPPGPLPLRHSFSTLAGGGRHRIAEEAGAAEDEALPAQADATTEADPANAATIEPTWHPELDALMGVAGTDFGNAVHALFEHRVPGRPITPDAALAALREHGVRPREGTLERLAVPLAHRLQAVLGAPLGDAHGPRLGALAAADLRAEMEFHYLLDGVSLRALRAACVAHGEPDLVPAREQALAGLMNGKIDLVFAHGGRFHVLDYKGNRLGSGPRASLEDYAPPALEAAMRASGYRLQALLYTVALERYLRERLGDAYHRAQHLGDCWYLFVRAVGLRLPDGTPCGVWRHRFGDALLDAVQAVLGARLGEVA